MKIMILIAPLQLLMIHNLTNEVKLFPKIVVLTPIERYSEKNFLYKISYSNRNKESKGGTHFIKESPAYGSPNQIKMLFTKTNQIPCCHFPQLRLNYSLCSLQPVCSVPTAQYFPFQNFKMFINKLVNRIKIQVTFSPIR